MPFAFNIDASHVTIRLDKIGPSVRERLRETLSTEAAAVVADARSRAEAHIHAFGGDPGAYVAGIAGGVSSKESRVLGFVRSSTPTVKIGGRDVPLAVLLEYGAHIPPHEILPSVASVLHFTGSAGEVFAKHVSSPGADVRPYPAILPALEAAAPRIRANLEATVRAAASAE